VPKRERVPVSRNLRRAEIYQALARGCFGAGLAGVAATAYYAFNAPPDVPGTNEQPLSYELELGASITEIAGGALVGLAFQLHYKDYQRKADQEAATGILDIPEPPPHRLEPFT
jgi:hypothetical protein